MALNFGQAFAKSFSKQLDKILKPWFKKFKEVNVKLAEAQARRRAVSEVASIANKRAKALERKGLEFTDAYRQFVGEQGKFGVKGKTQAEVELEIKRLEKFMNNAQSTMTGLRAKAEELQEQMFRLPNNVPYEDVHRYYRDFYKMRGIVEKELANAENTAAQLGYQSLHEIVFEYSRDINAIGEDGQYDAEVMKKNVTKLLSKVKERVTFPDGSSWSIEGGHK